MATTQVFLQLTEDFGGEAFGPIDQPEYRLGTAEDSHIRLADGLGIEPQHARLVRQSADTFYLAPVERSAAIWLFRTGSEPKLLRGPTVIRPGDSFALVTPEGVRFRLVEREVARPRPGAAATSGDGRLDEVKRGVAGEVARRARSAVFTTYWGRMGQQAWRMVKTGQIFSPVYVIGFLTATSGWTVGAWQCSRSSALDLQLSSTTEARDDCAADLEICRTGGVADDGLVDLPDLTARVLEDPAWTRSLEWPPMKEAMKTELVRLFTASERVFDSWYVGGRSPWRDAAERLQKRGGLPPELARLLAWGAVDPFVAPPARSEIRWSVLLASDAETEACLRGPMRLSYRQAVGLGLDARPDTWFDATETAAQKGRSVEQIEADIAAGLNATRLTAGQEPVTFGRFGRDGLVQGTVLQAARCYALSGEDDRDDLNAIARRTATVLGPDARGLPALDDDGGLSSRVAKWHALHLSGGAGADLDLDTRLLGSAFAGVSSSDPQGVASVAERTGRHLAHAVGLPCLVVLEQPDAWPEHLGTPPDFDACALLAARARYDRL